MRWIRTDSAIALLVSLGLHATPLVLLTRFQRNSDQSFHMDSMPGAAVSVSVTRSSAGPGSRSTTPPNPGKTGASGDDAAASGAVEAGVLAGEISRVNRVVEYPPMARKMEMQGLVRLRVTTDTGGRPSSIIIERSSGYELLDRAARRSLQSWTFSIRDRTFIIPIRYVLE